MEKLEFVYATYIHAHRKRLRLCGSAALRLLTELAFTRRYWGLTIQSDWSVGSKVTLEQNGVTVAHPALSPALLYLAHLYAGVV